MADDAEFSRSGSAPLPSSPSSTPFSIESVDRKLLRLQDGLEGT
jgi:hypothetical protein